MQTGNYTATFLETASWTLDTLNFKNVPLITPTGANQTVVKFQPRAGVPDKSEWFGTKHGQEIVESITLEANGQTFDLTKSADLPKAESYKLKKISCFGPYRGHWEVEVSTQGLKETAQFERIGDIDPVAFAYVFMHCWSPRMKDWLARLEDGSEVSERFSDKNSKALQKDISMLAVYSDEERSGAVLVYPKIYQSFENRKSFLNYFPKRHNKLYLTVSKDALTKEIYSCRIEGFMAEPDNWRKTATELAKQISDAK